MSGIWGNFGICDLGKPLNPLLLTLNIPNQFNEFKENAKMVLRNVRWASLTIIILIRGEICVPKCLKFRNASSGTLYFRKFDNAIWELWNFQHCEFQILKFDL